MSYSDLPPAVLDRVIKAARAAAMAELPEGYRPYGDFDISISVSDGCFPYKFTAAHIVSMLMARETGMVFWPQPVPPKVDKISERWMMFLKAIYNPNGL